jgi:addiction module RelE/StbE family toxin
MVNLVWDQAFKRKYKKIFTLNIELKKSFWQAISIFSQNPFDPKLRTHKLTGKLKGLWSFSISYDCRVIFRFTNDHDVLLIDIGSHDEVY